MPVAPPPIYRGTASATLYRNGNADDFNPVDIDL